MRSILCRLLLVPSIAAAASLVSPSALAETVTVPFSFSAAGTTFPAGAYTVHEDMQASIITLHQVNGTRNLSLAVGPGDPSPTDQRVVLRFTADGDEHALDTIQYCDRITAHLGAQSHGSHERASHEKAKRSVTGR